MNTFAVIIIPYVPRAQFFSRKAAQRPEKGGQFQ